MWGGRGVTTLLLRHGSSLNFVASRTHEQFKSLSYPHLLHQRVLIARLERQMLLELERLETQTPQREVRPLHCHDGVECQKRVRCVHQDFAGELQQHGASYREIVKGRHNGLYQTELRDLPPQQLQQ